MNREEMLEHRRWLVRAAEALASNNDKDWIIWHTRAQLALKYAERM